jgi:hypothetical protein
MTEKISTMQDSRCPAKCKRGYLDEDGFVVCETCRGTGYVISCGCGAPECEPEPEPARVES